MALDPIIRPLNRLKICAALNAAGATDGETKYEMRLSHLSELTEVPASALAPQLDALEQAGYITRFSEYGPSGAKDIVWVTLTKQGKQALEDHLEALHDLIQD